MSTPIVPPFTRESAIQKVRLAEDGWNTRDPEKVSLAYTMESRWRNRAEFANGRSRPLKARRDPSALRSVRCTMGSSLGRREGPLGVFARATVTFATESASGGTELRPFGGTLPYAASAARSGGTH